MPRKAFLNGKRCCLKRNGCCPQKKNPFYKKSAQSPRFGKSLTSRGVTTLTLSLKKKHRDRITRHEKIFSPFVTTSRFIFPRYNLGKYSDQLSGLHPVNWKEGTQNEAGQKKKIESINQFSVNCNFLNNWILKIQSININWVCIIHYVYYSLTFSAQYQLETIWRKMRFKQ